MIGPACRAALLACVVLAWACGTGDAGSPLDGDAGDVYIPPPVEVVYPDGWVTPDPGPAEGTGEVAPEEVVDDAELPPVDVPADPVVVDEVSAPDDAPATDEATVPEETLDAGDPGETAADVAPEEAVATDPGTDPTADPASDLPTDTPTDVAAKCAPGDKTCPCVTGSDCDQSYTTFCGSNACNKAQGICLITAAQFDGTTCDDKSACTTGDACKKGLCVGTPVVCGDLNPCTDDYCDPVSGCQTKPRTGFCEDGDKCSGPDWCVDGACVPGPEIDCDDKNDCTTDSCDSLTGCQHVALTGSLCNDHDACTVGDHCASGQCAPTGVASCDDGNPCTQDSCDPGTGCVHTPMNEGAKCDDGNACTNNDQCTGGTCLGVKQTPCPVCGDGTCNGTEDCHTCPADCTACAPSCVQETAIGCGASKSLTTALHADAIDSYFNFTCISLFQEKGPETVVPFSTPDAVHVRVDVKSSTQSPDLFVLTTNCAASSCIASALSVNILKEVSATFTPTPLQTYFLTVDGTSTTPFPFQLTTACLEAACGDGIDNDHDGLTDCDDPDCGGTPIACGAQVSGAVDDFSHVQAYGTYCGSAAGDTRDAVYQLTVATAQKITFTVDAGTTGDDLDLYLLMTGCGGSDCIQAARATGTTETLTFDAQPGTYRVVVERASAGSGSGSGFTLTTQCTP